MSKFDSGAMFTSNSDEWTTPKKLYDELDNEFGFDLDPCATDENHLCSKYFTRKQDGLNQNWGGAACSAILHTAT